ncbi:MAG: hypothetical protein SNJ71_02715 [Bacteroidales bacterium]
MNYISKILLLVILLVCGVQSFAQEEIILKRKEGPTPNYYNNQWFFGISLMTSYTGFVRFGYIKIHEDGRKEITWLTKQNFIKQATGQMFSKANKDSTNYFEKFKIKWETLDELWKLRYSEFPYYDPNVRETGWAGKINSPSPAQWDFLKKNYGYSDFNQFLYGDNMWKLLSDCQDPAWQTHYSSLK